MIRLHFAPTYARGAADFYDSTSRRGNFAPWRRCTFDRRFVTMQALTFNVYACGFCFLVAPAVLPPVLCEPVHFEKLERTGGKDRRRY